MLLSLSKYYFRRAIVSPSFRYSLYRPPSFLRCCATTSPSETDPRIGNRNLDQVKGLLWFENVYPPKIARIDIRQQFTTHNHEELIPALMPSGIRIVNMHPRFKEGGVIVDFELTPEWGGSRTAHEAAEIISDHLKSGRHFAKFSTYPVHAHEIKGVPFKEDLLSVYPSARIRIEFYGGSSDPVDGLSKEILFSLLRPYGRVNSITLFTPKEGPRYAEVVYRRVGSAVAARNCLHRMQIRGTTMLINYEPFIKSGYFTDLAVKYPRFLIPLVIGLIGLATYLVFDPLRVFNITNKITHRLSVPDILGGKSDETESQEENKSMLGKVRHLLLRYWTKPLLNLLNFNLDQELYPEMDKTDVARITQFLHTEPTKVLLLSGPRGSGRTSLVRRLTQNRRNVLTISVTQMLERGDDEFLNNLSKSLGFSPSFGAIKNFASILDALTPGASKAASDAKMNQVLKMLDCTSKALINISKANRPEKRKKQKNLEKENGSDQVHRPEEDNYVPTIVIDGFTFENKNKHDNFLDILALWSVILTSSQLARVLFIVDEPLAEENLSPSMPDVMTETIVLNDCPPENVKDYLHTRLPQLKEEELNKAVSILGGRFNDMLSFVKKLDGGDSTDDAIEEIVAAHTVVLKALLHQRRNPLAGRDGKSAITLPRPQLWRVMLLLAASPTGKVRYDDVLFSIFKGDDVSLRFLVRAGSFSIHFGLFFF
eukprot:TRINITY_DN5344_c0_g1_i1.p1 TRINITY_DN5344_c0_g1~~TRINITY_DN5344_c0_g1_i1.p1  ORF type:complete len:712 (-),score=130.66 TRINITY_DN5344_c0_g1_i1:21-2156(-)